MARLHARSAAAGALVAWAVLAAAWLVLEGTTVADWLVRPLQRPDTAGAADAIVVLGAGAYPPCGANPSSLQRTLLGVRLWQEGRAPRIVITGGPTSSSRGRAVGEVMAELARGLGVPAQAVVTETRSRSTWENALFTAPLLRELGVRRVLLVTDAIHMGRAEACFRTRGFEIERASVPQVCVSPSDVAMLRGGAREYAAWIYYRLKGRLRPV